MPRIAVLACRFGVVFRMRAEKKPLKKRCFVFDGWKAGAFVRACRHVDIGAAGGSDDTLSHRGARFFFARGVDSGKKRD
jgi:hypothetical protein